MPRERTVRRLEIEWVGVKTVNSIMAEVTSQSSRIIVNSRRPYVGISCYSLCSAPVCLGCGSESEQLCSMKLYCVSSDN